MKKLTILFNSLEELTDIVEYYYSKWIKFTSYFWEDKNKMIEVGREYLDKAIKEEEDLNP
jgi:hypothetical protein